MTAGREPGAVQVTSVQVCNLPLSHGYSCTFGPRPISHQPAKVHLILTTGPITKLYADETVAFFLGVDPAVMGPAAVQRMILYAEKFEKCSCFFKLLQSNNLQCQVF